MGFIDQINTLSSINDIVEKQIIVDEIGDIFEYYNLGDGEAIEGVELLINQFTQEQEESVKESILHAINNAIIYQDIGNKISYAPLISALPNSNEENVSYILSFLGYSENVRYERILKSYLNHSNKEVRGAALEALQQLDYTNKQVNRKGN